KTNDIDQRYAQYLAGKGTVWTKRYLPIKIILSRTMKDKCDEVTTTLKYMKQYGERTTEVAVKRKNNITHSYTVLPITSADRRLLDKFLLILREKENQFGQRVQIDLIVPPNIIVRASKSGKSSDGKYRTFLNEVLRSLVGKKFLLLLDSWKPQADLEKFRAVFPNEDSQLLIFSEESTGYIQPKDLSLFRSWRFIHKKIEHYTHINRTKMIISDRQKIDNEP
ncbi:unnamed protein product, partial [Didymodactylos carnosus]